MYRTVLWTLWERERVGRFGRMALKHVKKKKKENSDFEKNYSICESSVYQSSITAQIMAF